jgi:DNA-binding NarL/FixJ family response regulator
MDPRARILLVDDEALVTETLAPELQRRMRRGVDVAQDASEARQRLEAAAYALVLTDLEMEGEDGVALLERVRAEHPDAKRVLVTAHREAALQRLRGGTADPHAVIYKPYSLRRMAKTLALVLEGHREPRAWEPPRPRAPEATLARDLPEPAQARPRL